MHTDIKREGWIEKILPPVLRPYAALARLDRPIGIWLLLLPGWWAILLASNKPTRMDGEVWEFLVLFGIGAVVMRAAGCVVNDLWDRDLDRKVARTSLRPLASGEVTVRQAAVFLALLLCIGLVILLQFNALTIFLGVLSLPLIAIYPLMKRFTWWPQLFLGFTFNFGALMGWSAVTGSVDLPALLLYSGGIFWTLGYDTIYAHQDKEDDALAGIKSTALLFGEKSRGYVAAFFCIACILLFAACQSLFLIPAALHLAWQLYAWKPDDAESSLRIFKSNRDFGILVLLGLAAI
ncbi:MAG TPA: 4-hydroxybenzoate octaprenyltransferase [Alphaproteobacteria bacterium]|jgi:4-hydroxybenzoate polyprenyltransferase|nr:4-hydroxybenzoate octaprenyltransferase [Micavibrio sp.]HQX26334.1 4-hydroxybenzoate octaprenyltransferase [Alphaproteobacteria bacterium]